MSPPAHYAPGSLSGSSNDASASRIHRAPTARLPRVHIINSTYASHRRAAEGYRDLLKRLDCETHKIEQADVLIFHMECSSVPALLRRVPMLSHKYLVNICVWETNAVPHEYVTGLRCMDEIWTPTSYGAGILKQAGFDASWLPHVVEYEEPSEIPSYAWAQADRWLGLGQSDGAGLMPGAHAGANRFDVLAVTKQGDLRKNNEALLRAFEVLLRRCPHARLISKGGSWLAAADRYVAVEGSHIRIEQPASDQVMLALMLRCQLIATCTHAEGWGLTLSQAMRQGVAVLAPAYSGQLTFMSSSNSVLIDAYEDEIQGAWGWFRPPARWGHTRDEDIAAALVRAYDERHTDAAEQRIERARQDIEAFAPERVEKLLYQHIRRIGQTLQAGWRPQSKGVRIVD